MLLNIITIMLKIKSNSWEIILRAKSGSAILLNCHRLGQVRVEWALVYTSSIIHLLGILNPKEKTTSSAKII